MIVYDIEPKWFSRPYVDLVMILTHVYSGIDPLNKNH